MSELYLVHHGIKGQKWGNRRYQYKDGSVTPEGAARYYVHNGNYHKGTGSNTYSVKTKPKKKPLTDEEKKARNKKIALAAVGTAAAVGVGAYALHKKKQIDNARKMLDSMVYMKKINEDMIAKANERLHDEGWKSREEQLKKTIENSTKQRDIADERIKEMLKNKSNAKYLANKNMRIERGTTKEARAMVELKNTTAAARKDLVRKYEKELASEAHRATTGRSGFNYSDVYKERIAANDKRMAEIEDRIKEMSKYKRNQRIFSR